MNAHQVLALLERLRGSAVEVWLDGGWGVDALLGEQTRDHDDVDLVLARADVGIALELLAADGFTTERDLLPTAIAVRHPDGRAVDLHPIDPRADGGGDQDLGNGTRFHYPAPVTGRVADHGVPCCDAATQVAAHTGYEPDAADIADVAALVARFGLATPAGYRGTAG